MAGGGIKNNLFHLFGKVADTLISVSASVSTLASVYCPCLATPRLPNAQDCTYFPTVLQNAHDFTYFPAVLPNAQDFTYFPAVLPNAQDFTYFSSRTSETL